FHKINFRCKITSFLSNRFTNFKLSKYSKHKLLNPYTTKLKKITFAETLSKTSMYEFTIIVPVYNEEENLPRVEKDLLSYSKIATKKTAILFVNDGSKDNSQVLIEEICNRNEAFHFISFKQN